MYDIAPCLTPTCRPWSFKRKRWMVGEELLALQGFPVESLDLTGLVESDICRLAGNAMSVPVVGAIIYMVLAFVNFPEEPDAPCVNEFDVASEKWKHHKACIP